MSPYIAEFIGTAILVLLGNGAVANVLLAKTKGKGADLIVIVMGWAMAVFVAVYVTASFSGAHLNPIVTISLALAGKFAWSKVGGYVLAQMLGGMAGALLVWLAYRQHFAKEADADLKLAVFCTAPAIRSVTHNVLTEAICTFVLILGVLYLASPQVGLGALDALPVGLLVLGIGISLGGPTGYAMSPRATCRRASCTRCCRSPASATATGAMHGCPSSVRCSAAPRRPACTCTCTRRSDRRLTETRGDLRRAFYAPSLALRRFVFATGHPRPRPATSASPPYPRQPTGHVDPALDQHSRHPHVLTNPDARPKPLAATSRAPASK